MRIPIPITPVSIQISCLISVGITDVKIYHSCEHLISTMGNTTLTTHIYTYMYMNCESTLCLFLHKTGSSSILTISLQHILYMGQVTKVWLSCYLVLLSFDGKTRQHDSHTSVTWPIYIHICTWIVNILSVHSSTRQGPPPFQQSAYLRWSLGSERNNRFIIKFYQFTNHKIIIQLVECRYNVVQYNTILHASLQWLWWNIYQSFNPQKTPHISP